MTHNRIYQREKLHFSSYYLPQLQGFHMQQGLVDSLAELKLEDFELAIQLVVDRHPGMLQPNAEEMDIDLEPLDSLTLRQLSAFCRFCLHGRTAEAQLSWPGLLFGSGAAPPTGRLHCALDCVPIKENQDCMPLSQACCFANGVPGESP